MSPEARDLATASPDPSSLIYYGIMAVEATGPQRLIADRAYFELRDRIVTLRLPPGAILREDVLMAELGIGRTPLREAVKRLELENLVTVQPRRGTRVSEIDTAHILHITEVRADLEGYAAELATVRLDNDRRARAEEMIAELETLGGDPDTLMHRDEEVHRFIWEAARNPYLFDTLERFFALSLRIWYLVLDRVPGLGAAVHDQRLLLEAVVARDGARARAAMRDHVLAFQREILVAFSQS
jgi:DNA-binding GntR family transcriptional regulator